MKGDARQRAHNTVMQSVILSRARIAARGLPLYNRASGRCFCGAPGLTMVASKRTGKQHFFCKAHKAQGEQLMLAEGVRFRPPAARSTSRVNVLQTSRTNQMRRRSGVDLMPCPICPAEMTQRGLYMHMVQRHGMTLRKYHEVKAGVP